MFFKKCKNQQNETAFESLTQEDKLIAIDGVNIGYTIVVWNYSGKELLKSKNYKNWIIILPYEVLDEEIFWKDFKKIEWVHKITFNGEYYWNYLIKKIEDKLLILNTIWYICINID